MSAIDTRLVGKRLSFIQLFVEYNFTVEIPIIQRDYAQGRKGKREVRELFLNALYDYLNEGTAHRDLDFVYGTTIKEVSANKFIPLDGQQRLTTLFLLHWYLANISGNSEKFKNLLLREKNSRFTYLTRPSSSDFINALLTNEIDIASVLSKDLTSNTLSNLIKDKGWFYLSWSYDPTIQSILVMLDAIHEKFNTRKDFYERLVDIDNPIITFLFLDLNEFKLTDDLYIKMNSRGKPLTSFENFKAKLEQHIDTLFENDEKKYVLNDNLVSAKEYFSFQIDTKWANLFWQYRALVGKPDTYDEELMNFIRAIIATQYILEKPLEIETIKELIKNDTATSEITENISFYRFKSLGVLSKNFIQLLIESFDVFANGDQKIKKHLSTSFYFNEDDVFEKALKYSLSMPERLMLYAYLKYLIRYKNEKNNFNQWMRVVHNLIDNTRIEDAEQMVNGFKSIDTLLQHSDNIYQYLTSNEVSIDFFSSWQIEEERLKAHLISKSSIWESVIEKSEQSSFHKGQIAYLFEFSGIWDYFIANGNVDWNQADDENYLSLFEKYNRKSIALFAIYDTDANKDYLLERSLLTKGDYLISASNDRYNFCSSKNVSNYQRDYSWKRLLRFTAVDPDDYWKKGRCYVKYLIDDNRFNENLVVESLQIISNDLPDDWRRYFIKNLKLLAYCSQGFIKFSDNGFIELYSQAQANHKHIDMYLYNFYLENLVGELIRFKPFLKVDKGEVKNNDDYSYIVFYDWFYKKKNYELKIYRLENEFVAEFGKAKGNRSQIEISEEIRSVLEGNGFVWDEEQTVYSKSCPNEDTLLSLIHEICADFNSL
jgi:hypothetical protein